ncbi:MAG TPA: hypothetical protein PLO53_07425, partial [Candidatus Hydrogenedentes bacterium]|nr:hypothetical protein [Candidatus Hydrogenedentota bacterium]
MVNVLLIIWGLSLMATPEDVPLEFIQRLQGDNWYGVYMNGAKVGYSVHKIGVQDGKITLTEDAHFSVIMSGTRQNM